MYESEAKIYPREVSGTFNSLRMLAVYVLLGIYYLLPWINIGDRQALLFDLPARQFHIFGLTLWPQDFPLLALLLIIAAISLFFFTALAGRLWCGFACPQTVWTEVFIWMEQWTEGKRTARIRLDRGPWTAEKIARKTAKQILWISFAAFTGFTFVGYFTPIRELSGAVVQGALGPWETFWILFYGFATYGNAGYLREQVCKYMCPYARFQSAMFDKDTMIISYDPERGEPRGTRGRSTDLKAANLGHCIDCGLCVQVCPTGIDIRNGLQYECIGCAACIDVCNGVMDKMKYPRGLVRYATQNGMARHWTRAQMFRHVLRPRVLVYTAVLILIVAAMGASIALRSPFRVDVVRDRGALARIVGDGYVENIYRLQIMNATEQRQRYRLEAAGLAEAEVDARGELEVDPAQARWVPIAVRIPPGVVQRLGPGTHRVQLRVQQVGATAGSASREVVEKSTFLIPR